MLRGSISTTNFMANARTRPSCASPDSAEPVRAGTPRSGTSLKNVLWSSASIEILLKCAAIIEYVEDKSRLFAAGPFAEGAGALWVLEAKTAADVDEIVKGDPSAEAGVFVSWKIRPLAYWSAKERVGGMSSIHVVLERNGNVAPRLCRGPQFQRMLGHASLQR